MIRGGLTRWDDRALSRSSCLPPSALPFSVREKHLVSDDVWKERNDTFHHVAELCGDRFASLEVVGMFVARALEDPGRTGAVVQRCFPIATPRRFGSSNKRFAHCLFSVLCFFLGSSAVTAMHGFATLVDSGSYACG